MDNNNQSTYPQSYPMPPDRISEDKLKEILKTELLEWHVVKSPLPEDPFITREELFREFRFEDFDKVLEFMTKVGVACNTFPHHPRWENVWTTLKVWLSTWDSTHIISYKDIMLARHMEQVFREFSVVTTETRTEERVKKEQLDFVHKMKELISADKLEETFTKINIYTAVNTEKSIRDELILLTQRYNRVRKFDRTNTQPLETLNLELQKVSQSLLDVLDELIK